MVQYYAKFLPNLADHLAPLHQLLKKGTPWTWETIHDSTFNEVKAMLSRDQVLTHFDPTLPISIACDSSSYGLGVVLSRQMPDGQERPIAYASRSLSTTEQRYAQIEREALGLYWGIKKFGLYLEGRRFTLITDHKPLKFIMNPDKAVPVTAAARIQRWSLFLGAFSYQIQYRPTLQHANCDGLSRLPLAERPTEKADDTAMFYTGIPNTLPVTAKEVRQATRKDPLLTEVIRFVEEGWTETVPRDELKIFHRRREELTTHLGILMWGSRVVVPEKLQQQLLQVLHEGHIGVVKMKGLARSHMWWPHIDKHIENITKIFPGCQETARTPARPPLHRWEYPARPWQRLHVDFA